MEMSMVLVIIALLAGSIVVGQSLIHNAELQSIVDDADQYKKAILMFKEKYKELPGDMSNAESFWGTDTVGCPDTTPAASAQTATCNGNGDGFIGDAAGSALGGATSWEETYRVWQQLSDAGMVAGQYSGVLSSRTSGNNADPGINIPKSKIDGAGFTVLHAKTPAETGVFSAQYEHIIVFGKPAGKKASAYNPSLSSEDALEIDKKIDDGLPGTGSVMTFTPDLTATPNCATTNDPTTAAYKTSASGLTCSLIFITGF